MEKAERRKVDGQPRENTEVYPAGAPERASPHGAGASWGEGPEEGTRLHAAAILPRTTRLACTLRLDLPSPSLRRLLQRPACRDAVARNGQDQFEAVNLVVFRRSNLPSLLQNGGDGVDGRAELSLGTAPEPSLFLRHWNTEFRPDLDATGHLHETGMILLETSCIRTQKRKLEVLVPLDVIRFRPAQRLVRTRVQRTKSIVRETDPH